MLPCMNTKSLRTNSLGGFLVKAQPKMFNYAVCHYQPILFRINQLSWCVAKIKLDPLSHSCFCSITLCSAIHCFAQMGLVGIPKSFGVSVMILKIIPSFYYSISSFRTNRELSFIIGDFAKMFQLPITWQWIWTAQILLSQENINIRYNLFIILSVYLIRNIIEP